MIIEKIKRITDLLFTEQVYCIGVSTDDIHYVITPLDDRYWYADPMLYRKGKKYYVLSEVMDRYEDRGYIGISEVLRNGKISRPVPIIREPFHMSFPYVFQWKGITYLLPETAEAKELRFYRAGEDIFEWNLAFSIPGISVVDTVVYQDNTDEDMLYLIGSIPKNEDPHLCNMVIYRLNMNSHDIEEIYRNYDSSYHDRNGGPLLYNEKGWIRISQESTKEQYGRNIVAYTIKEFPKEQGDSYKEEYLYKLEAKDLYMKFPKGEGKWHKKYIHTYGKCGKLYMIDTNVRHTSVSILFQRIRRKYWQRLLRQQKGESR